MQEQVEQRRGFREGGIQGEFRGIAMNHLEDQHLNLPFSDFRRWTEDKSIFSEIYGSFPISRLGRIKTLSFLSYTGPDNKQVTSMGFVHTRLDHSLTVGIIAGEIARRNAFILQPGDPIKLEIAGIIHDIATPAYGDTTKRLDPEALHEENTWQDLLTQEGIDFCKKYKTTPEEIDQIIKNKGTLGQILDIADRISYVAKDLHYVVGEIPDSFDSNPYLMDLRALLLQNKDIGDIYKNVHVNPKDGQVFFSDADKLYAFLHLRALLWKGLYMHPSSQGRDILVSGLLRPIYERGDLTGSMLRRMGDDDLDKIIYDEYKEYFSGEYSLDMDLRNWHPMWEKFDTKIKAEEAAIKLKKEGVKILATKYSGGFDTGVSYRVLSENRRIEPFRDADSRARRIEAESKTIEGYYVFYVDPQGNSNVDRLAKSIL